MFHPYFSKGHNSGKGHNPDGKQICFSYSYMKVQNPSVHGSEVMLCIKKRNGRTRAHTDGRTHEPPRSNMPLQLLLSWGHNLTCVQSAQMPRRMAFAHMAIPLAPPHSPTVTTHEPQCIFPNVGYLFTYIRPLFLQLTYYLTLYYPKNRTLPYNHGLPVHYTWKIIRGYINIALRMILIRAT